MPPQSVSLRATNSGARLRVLHLSLIIAIAAASITICHAEWTQTITCPAGHLYRDVRKDAGREEYCELALPGSLVVKDGPYRFWYSTGHPGADGVYSYGRQVGLWKECDRFDRCQGKDYEAVFPEERKRPAFKPRIPVSYSQGQYRFDFASCRSGWVTETDTPDPISLNIGGGSPYRCEIAYIPQSAMEHGGEGDYFCRIPYAIGVQAFPTLNLLHELPRKGLPQFCNSIYLHGEPLLVQDRHGFPVATTIDVLSARTEDGTLLIRMNKFADTLVRQAAEQAGPLTTLLCLHALPATHLDADINGNLSFSCPLSPDAGSAEKERACAAGAFAGRRGQEHSP